MTAFWAELPPGRAAFLAGASAEAIALSLEPLPDGAPAVVTCWPCVEPTPARVVAAVLDQLEAAAVELYPAWLPGADMIEEAGGAAVAAVRALASQAAATTPHFRPFLADLAARSLRDRGEPGGGFAVEVRAAGLARVIAASFGRAHAALLVQVPDGLEPAGEQALFAACEWLAQQGKFAVWLAGAPLPTVDRALIVRVVLPEQVARLAGAGTPRPWAVRFPALAGRPHPASRAEQALEAALAAQPWAVGRVWNQTYRPHALSTEIRVDLMWQRERCVVEIDGPEHCGALHYEADRRRDVLLQLAGFAVLRFTNEQVLFDLAAVLSQLELFITNRRDGKD